MSRLDFETRSAAGRRGTAPGKRKNVASEPGGMRRPAGLIVAACAVVAVLVAADGLAFSGEIHRGVEVGTVDVGGKTTEEARMLLGERASGTLENVRLTGASVPEDATVSAYELGTKFDARSSAREAYAVGREGSVAKRIADRLRSRLWALRLSPDLDYDPERIRTEVQGLAGRLDKEPRDASVNVSGKEVSVTGSREGYATDVAATAKNIGEAFENLEGEAEVIGGVLEPKVATDGTENAAAEARRAISKPLVLAANGKSWTVSPAELGSTLEFPQDGGRLTVSLDAGHLKESLSDVYAEMTVEAVEAGYDFADGATAEPNITVTPSREGLRVEDEKLLTAIEAGVFEGRREYEVPVAIAEPEITTDEAEKMKPTKLLGSYRTDYSVVPDDGTRVENLDISSSAVNGTLLAPGEVFSMNGKVSGLEYNEAKVIVGGAETEADGGGLCQVTSTLYNAANYAGLDVIERTPHSAQLPYIRPGMDATVWWGGPGEEDDLDMKFQNTTDGYLLLREFVADDGYVRAEIWGRPTGTEVEMTSKPVSMSEGGSDWVTYQTVEKNGEVVFDGVLHKDSYQPLVDEKGKEIPPSDVPVAPVDP